jgi:hypothetical protein
MKRRRREARKLIEKPERRIHVLSGHFPQRDSDWLRLLHPILLLHWLSPEREPMKGVRVVTGMETRGLTEKLSLCIPSSGIWNMRNHSLGGTFIVHGHGHTLICV